jgi:membrane protease YdiL (CAAX protease family)
VSDLPPDPLLPPVSVPAAPSRFAQRAIAIVEVLLCSGFPTQVAIAAVLAAAGIGPYLHDGTLSLRYVFILTMVDSAALGVLIAGLLTIRGERPAIVLFGVRRRAREAMLGVLLLPVVFAIAFGLLLLLRAIVPWLHNLEKNPLEALIRSRTDAAMFAVVAVVGGGIREEMQRGFILHRFDQHLGGGWVGLILYSAAFGAGHVLQGWDAAVTLMGLGGFWGFVYLRRRSILPAMVSHAGFNAAEIIRYTLAR